MQRICKQNCVRNWTKIVLRIAKKYAKNYAKNFDEICRKNSKKNYLANIWYFHKCKLLNWISVPCWNMIMKFCFLPLVVYGYTPIIVNRDAWLHWITMMLIMRSKLIMMIATIPDDFFHFWSCCCSFLELLKYAKFVHKNLKLIFIGECL